ncbi:MAG: thiolase family protein [Bacteriovoracaceae bacterium]|jgi:acetyl-CoA C-acetyltransferase/acetyl-CoA acyltransferase|nr:acetyl-CoA C-acyltransferase [Halobacteriovoraceae bacterium]MDP7319990.1 thiolase family protein [Bacteriovoracaceae bacterium]
MKPVYLVKGNRSPQAKSGTILKDVAAPYLGHYLIRDIMDQTSIPNDQVDEVIIGNTGNPAKYPNVGRVIALEAGLDKKTSGYTVHRNCASGMEAVSQAFVKIASGRSDIIFAGGVENMSQMPLLYNEDMTDFFIDLMKAKSSTDKMKVLSSFRLPHLSPVISIEQGLTDPFCGLNMGQTAEKLAREFKFSRTQQDEFANNSHHKAVRAQQEGKLKDEIVSIITGKKLDSLISEDNGPRADSSLEKLAKLKPYFEKKTGTVTVGNACPITDGGSMWLLCSEEAVKKYNLEPMARMVDFHFHGLEPERMGLGPVLAMDGVLKRTGMSLDQMDLVEINEAFAAQVLSCLEVMKNKKLSDRWNVDLLGELDQSKLNVNGGAIALGHPVGSTGSRLMVTLAHELGRRKAKYGLASLCIGGGQGGAVIIENLNQ